MVYQIVVLSTIFTLHLLFDGSQLAKRRRYEPDNNSGHQVPCEHQEWAFDADQFSEFLGEKYDVEHGLSEVEVQRG